MSTNDVQLTTEYHTTFGSLLNLAIVTDIALVVLGLGFYVAILPQTFQNMFPILLVFFLGLFSWVVRSRLPYITSEQVRPLFVQWGTISVVGILLAIVLVLTYPI